MAEKTGPLVTRNSRPADPRSSTPPPNLALCPSGETLESKPMIQSAFNKSIPSAGRAPAADPLRPLPAGDHAWPSPAAIGRLPTCCTSIRWSATASCSWSFRGSATLPMANSASGDMASGTGITSAWAASSRSMCSASGQPGLHLAAGQAARRADLVADHSDGLSDARS